MDTPPELTDVVATEPLPISPSAVVPESPQRKPKKKRLTLQERLALAAKGKASPEPQPIPDTPDVTKVSDVSMETVNDSEPKPEPIAVQEPKLETENDVKPINSENNNGNVLEQEIAYLKTQNKTLQDQNKLLQNQNKLLQVQVQGQSQSPTAELAKKDEIIAQLMKEGEQLSIKELKLNDTIKKLKITNQSLELVVEDFNQKNQDNSLRITEIDTFLKKYKFKTVDQLMESYNKLIKYENIDEELNALTKELQVEKTSFDKKSREYNELKIQFDLSKQNYKIELIAKDDTIQGLRNEIKQIQEDHNEEVMRLENKIESLMVNQTYGESNGKTIENSHYSSLKNEFLKSKENWHLIEMSLNTKISDLQNVIELMKKNKLQTLNEMKSLKNLISLKDELIAYKDDEFIVLNAKLQDLQAQLNNKYEENSILESKLDKINLIYNNEKSSLTKRIEQLEIAQETRDQDYLTEEPQEYPLESPRYPMESPRFPSDASQYRSYDNSFSHSLYDRSLDMSSDSLTDKDVSDLNHAHNYSFNSNNGADQSHSFQLITKMSSSIKNLKIEINSLKDENSNLASSKQEVQRKLLEITKNSNLVDELKAELEDLRKQLDQKSQHESQLLELIGEKEERVGELVQDVQDLKDLCKLQVQQMIEMQDAK